MCITWLVTGLVYATLYPHTLPTAYNGTMFVNDELYRGLNKAGVAYYVIFHQFATEIDKNDESFRADLRAEFRISYLLNTNWNGYSSKNSLSIVTIYQFSGLQFTTSLGDPSIDINTHLKNYTLQIETLATHWN
jgi:K+-transporting ATPase A subunit